MQFSTENTQKIVCYPGNSILVLWVADNVFQYNSSEIIFEGRIVVGESVISL